MGEDAARGNRREPIFLRVPRMCTVRPVLDHGQSFADQPAKSEATAPSLISRIGCLIVVETFRTLNPVSPPFEILSPHPASGAGYARLKNPTQWVIPSHGHHPPCSRPEHCHFRGRPRAHVHVFGDGQVKVNLVGANGAPELVWATDMKRGDVRRAMQVVVEQQEFLLAKWRAIHA